MYNQVSLVRRFACLSIQPNCNVPPFEIKPISPDHSEHSEIWNILWPDDRDDANAQAAHAYKVLQTGGIVTVYYSTAFTPYRDAVARLKANTPARLPAFDANYAIWIGYHAILQSRRQESFRDLQAFEDEAVERIQEVERQTVARVQVRQALRTAELMEQREVT
jgi:hypothetical protein